MCTYFKLRSELSKSYSWLHERLSSDYCNSSNHCGKIVVSKSVFHICRSTTDSYFLKCLKICLLLPSYCLCVNSIDPIRLDPYPVADPGFSPGGAPTPKSAIIFQFFAENCMKMKEFGPPGGGRASLAPPLGSANATPPYMGNKFNQPPTFHHLLYSSTAGPWTVDRSCVTIINPSLSQPLGFIIVM